MGYENSLKKSYIPYEDYEFDKPTLLYFRTKIDEFKIDILREIARENKQHRGLVKTRYKDYRNKRKQYDDAFLVLETLGFIDKKEDGTATPYFVSVRGRQLITLLAEEKLEREREMNNND
jgi:hypothetical protein